MHAATTFCFCSTRWSHSLAFVEVLVGNNLEQTVLESYGIPHALGKSANVCSGHCLVLVGVEILAHSMEHVIDHPLVGVGWIANVVELAGLLDIVGPSTLSAAGA